MADQRHGDSLLNWMEHLIRRRRETPEIVFGTWSLVPVTEAAILALRHDWGQRSMLTIHNLSGKPHRISLSLGQAASHGLADLFGHGGFVVEKDGTVTIEVGGL